MRKFDIDEQAEYIYGCVDVLKSIECLNGFESYSHTIEASIVNIRQHYKNGSISVSLAILLINNLKDKISRAERSYTTWLKK